MSFCNKFVTQGIWNSPCTHLLTHLRDFLFLCLTMWLCLHQSHCSYFLSLVITSGMQIVWSSQWTELITTTQQLVYISLVEPHSHPSFHPSFPCLISVPHSRTSLPCLIPMPDSCVVTLFIEWGYKVAGELQHVFCRTNILHLIYCEKLTYCSTST